MNDIKKIQRMFKSRKIYYSRKLENEWKQLTNILPKSTVIIVMKKVESINDVLNLMFFYFRGKEFVKLINLIEKYLYLIENTIDNNIKSGAYFHVGEILYFQNQFSDASYYFSRCLDLNSAHNKALDYLRKLQ